LAIISADATTRKGRGRRRAKPMSEINVTPFVDVMLVLLIVFMVTAPLLTVGVTVDLPRRRTRRPRRRRAARQRH
jgi:biopolymer transport protein TolR